MKKKKVIAILCADIHLSHKPPIWRSTEENWYTAMQRPLDEIQKLQDKYQCPVLVAGDIFDKWNSPAELINFAIQNIPENVWAIPGQHDVPNHNIKELHRSAFANLTLSNTIHYELDYSLDKFYLHSIPFGTEMQSCGGHGLRVAIIHDYAWIPGFSYPNAPKEKHLFMKSQHLINGKYYGYDVIVYGDNHKSFQTQIGKTTIFNCGTLMRRKSDEENYKPQVGLLYSDGSVEPHYLDISRDKHLAAEEAKPREQMEELDMDELADELRKLGSSALDFSDAVKQYCVSKGVKEPVQDIILKAMENK